MIFNAALEEFTEHGYHKASTNRIVKKAGISKGTLFYYFNSKKELYQDLVDHSIELVKNEYIGLIDGTITDFIEKYRQASVVKLTSYHKHTQMFAFFSKLYLNSDEPLEEKSIEKIMAIRKEAFSKFFDNIDTSLFREDMPAEQVIKLIRWTLEGYEKELTEKLKDVFTTEMDYAPYWDEFYKFLDTLKKVYYKEGMKDGDDRDV